MTTTEFGDRMIPISITVKLKHIAILENKIESKEINNSSEYIRKLIERDIA